MKLPCTDNFLKLHKTFEIQVKIKNESRARCEIYSKLTIKTADCHKRPRFHFFSNLIRYFSNFSVIDFEQVVKKLRKIKVSEIP